MAKLTINGKDYDLETLTEKAKGHVGSIQFIDSELQRLNATFTVLNTARNAYIQELIKEVGDTESKAEPAKAPKAPRTSSRTKK